MRYFLKSVKVEGFRGVNNEGDPLTVKFTKDKINSIFAMNGIGKSSLFDAVFYAITGALPKLDVLHQYERSQDYYVNRFHSQLTGTIELEFESNESSPVTHTIKVVRQANGGRTVTSPSGYADPEELLKSLNNSFALIDYHTFSTFINHSPLERGRSFASLLGLDAYSDFRQTFKTAVDTRALRSDLDIPSLETESTAYDTAATTALTRLDTTYSALISENASDATKLDKYATKVLATLKQVDLLKEIVTADDLDSVDFEAIKLAIKAAEGGKDKDRFLAITTNLGKLEALGSPDPDAIQAERDGLKANAQNLKELFDATAGAMRKQLYAAADHLISNDGWHDETICPLCGSGLDQPIADIVAEQQRQYEQADAKILAIQTQWATSELQARTKILEQALGSDVPEAEKKLSDTTTKINDGTIKKQDISDLSKYYDKLEARLSRAVAKYTTEKVALQKRLPPSLVQLTEQVEQARQFREHLRDYKANIERSKKVKTKLEGRKRWQTFVGAAAEVYAKAEADLSKNKLATIETEYKEMFADVMNADDVVPSLQRNEASENLYVQLSDFHGQHDLSAKPLLAESFRNALAISVYLSAAMKHRDAPRFIILDDISSSFDASHQLRLMEYVRTKLQYGLNPNGLQFIVLTHDELMQNLFEHLSSNGDVRHQVIEGSPPYNLTMRGQNAARLRSNAATPLTAGQLEAGKPWVRPYLECMLMEVIRNLNIPVPLEFSVKDRRRMIQNCLNAINDAVNLHVAAGDIVLDATQLSDMQNTHLTALIANYVSHFETGSGGSISAPVLLGVLDSVDKFADCFKYDFIDPTTGGTSRRYYKSLSLR